MTALISGTTGSNSENLFALDSPFIEEGFRVYNITLRPIGVEQRVKPRGTASIDIMNVKIFRPSVSIRLLPLHAKTLEPISMKFCMEIV